MKYLIFFIMILMTGCSDAARDGELSPEDVSIGFFNAIYNERDVEKATQYVDVPLKKVLRSYYIAPSVQRYMLNLAMTDVTMAIEDIDIDFFRKFTSDVTVVVKLTGKKAGENWKDNRTLRLHKRGKQWVIVEILPENGKINVGGY